MGSGGTTWTRRRLARSARHTALRITTHSRTLSSLAAAIAKACTAEQSCDVLGGTILDTDKPRSQIATSATTYTKAHALLRICIRIATATRPARAASGIQTLPPRCIHAAAGWGALLGTHVSAASV